MSGKPDKIVSIIIVRIETKGDKKLEKIKGKTGKEI